MASTIPGRLRTADQSSRIAIKRIREWVKTCDVNHGCARHHSYNSVSTLPLLPTRVLDVSPMLNRIGTQADRVYLREPRDLRDRYLAVSHCWGLSHRLVTKKSNLPAHKSGILVTELAATFQDAIHVARGLGIRFVWIDSLCIVQDDFADWEREATRMGDFYSNAYLTVSALSSQDDSDGMFTPFEERIPRPMVSSDTRSTGRRCFANATPVVEQEAGYGLDEHMYHYKNTFAKCKYLCGTEACLVFVTPEWMPSSFKPKRKKRTMEGNTSRTRGYDDGDEHTQMYLIGQFGGSFDPFEDEPLVTRGWTLQERLLSRRTVHFGADEMFWECQQYVLAEDGAVLKRTFPKRNGVHSSRVPQLSTHAAGNVLCSAGVRTLVVPRRPYRECSTGRCLRRCRRLRRASARHTESWFGPNGWIVTAA